MKIKIATLNRYGEAGRVRLVTTHTYQTKQTSTSSYQTKHTSSSTYQSKS